MDNVENLCSALLHKMQTVDSMFSILYLHPNAMKHHIDFVELHGDFNINVVGAFSEYITTKDVASADKFKLCIASNDYYGRLTKIVNGIALTDPPRQVKLLIKEFNQHAVESTIHVIDAKTCPCGSQLQVYPKTSELICDGCGAVTALCGALFDDNPVYVQEGSRVKHGKYDTSRHCRFWIERIQALENIEIDAKCVTALTMCMEREGLSDKTLMCSHIRSYLKETGNTQYNDHIPLLRKIITGYTPPQLTREELRILYNLFDKSIGIFDIVKHPGKSNNIYYPYIIYKILDHILQKGQRKKEILQCIHLQSRETLIANDNIWILICKHLRVVLFVPTIRI